MAMSADAFSPTPFLPTTPTDALGSLICEKVIIENRTFVIERPRNTDGLLDHPKVQSGFDADEYLPYWADLWPAARMLAKAIVRQSWPSDLQALEIGCGLGLPGVAALAQGMRVIFSDYDATALKFAANNALINGFSDFETFQLDWRCPPDDLQVNVVLASDLIYELRNVEPLVVLIKRVLLPGGLCLLTDQDRATAQRLRETLQAAGLTCTTQIMRAGEPGGRRVKGTLYRITHAPRS